MKNDLLTPALSKAARALLEWQQKDLAMAAKLSLTAVNNFERAIGTPHENTMLAIQNALEENGIEFMPDGGLRHVGDIAAVSRYSGDEFIAEWAEDIYAAVRRSGEQIMTASTDEGFWYHPSFKKVNEHYLAWAERLDLKLKSLVPEGQKVPYRSRRNYRYLPSEMIGKITYCIYADRLAYVLWKKKQIIVLRSPLVVEPFRNQFLYLWRIGKAVSTAEQ